LSALIFLGWCDMGCAKECSFPKRKHAHTPTSSLPTDLFLLSKTFHSSSTAFINIVHPTWIYI
jgi:hypothetical protein